MNSTQGKSTLAEILGHAFPSAAIAAAKLLPTSPPALPPFGRILPNGCVLVLLPRPPSATDR